MWLRLFIALLILLAATHGWRASLADENDGQAGAFLRNGVGAKAMALGGAFVAVANDPTATYWNPAGLPELQRVQFLAAINQMSGDRTHHFFSAVFPIGSKQAFGLSWIGLGISGIEARTANTPAPEYLFTDSQNAIMFSYARKLFSGLSFGGNAKVLHHKLNRKQAIGTGFDVALLLQPIESIRIGFVVQDINTNMAWSGGYQEVVPQVARAGLACQLTETLLLALDACRVANGATRFSFGAEFNPLRMLPVRIGWGAHGMAMGAGLEIPLPAIQINVDYGFSKDELDGSDAHKISIGMAFSLSAESPERIRDKELAFNDKAGSEFIEIVVTSLHAREGPGLNYRVSTTLKKGDKFILLAREGYWYKIKLSKKTFGWVHGKYVKEII